MLSKRGKNETVVKARGYGQKKRQGVAIFLGGVATMIAFNGFASLQGFRGLGDT